MDGSISTLRERLLDASSHPPSWLARLLDVVPGKPADVIPHDRGTHADLTAEIADGMYHPAIEACLHLMNVSRASLHLPCGRESVQD